MFSVLLIKNAPNETTVSSFRFVTSSTNPSKTREVHMTMAQIDTISGDMHETCRIVDGSASSVTSQPLYKLLAPHRMNMLQWNWARKVTKFNAVHQYYFV